MKKILVSDIDGTLLLDGKIHEKSLVHLKIFKERGHSFVLCTGRDFENTKVIFDENKLEVDALILCNGALILDKELKELQHRTIDKDVIISIYKDLKDNPSCGMAFTDGYSTYALHKLSLLVGNEFKVTFVTEEELFEKNRLFSLVSIAVMNGDIIETEKLKIEIEKKYGEFVSVYRNKNFIDVVPLHCSKAHGISQITPLFDVEDDDVIVIGDSWNDLSMFKGYKNSYTFSYAEEEIKPHAGKVIDLFHHCVEELLELNVEEVAKK